jgi:membrane-associated protein
MTYSKFALYNVTGAILWIGIFLGGGFYFGGLEVVQKNMKLVILGIIIVSVMPIAWEVGKAWLEKRRAG